MSKKKKKQIAWHKKRGKFIKASQLKTGSPTQDDRHSSQDDPELRNDIKKNKIKAFSQNLSAQIKKAVRPDSQ